MSIARVYISHMEFMEPNTAVDAYLSVNQPESLIYKMGLVTPQEHHGFLNLDKPLQLAMEWFIERLSRLNIGPIDQVILSSSTLNLTPPEAIWFWSQIGEHIALSSNADLSLIGGKGCNALVYAAGKAAGRIRSAEHKNAVILSADFHSSGENRFSDYAFFSDSAALVVLTTQESNLEVTRFATVCASYTPDAFALTNQFDPSIIGSESCRMYTLNTFPFLLNKKYSNIPKNVSFTAYDNFQVHGFCIDPFANMYNDTYQGLVLLHVESPPFHVDELAIRKNTRI